MICPGVRWESAIIKHIEVAAIVLLLVCRKFLWINCVHTNFGLSGILGEIWHCETSRTSQERQICNNLENSR